MRITCAPNEIIEVQGRDMWDECLTYLPRQAPKLVTKYGAFDLSTGVKYRIFGYERLEYRPSWVDDKEAADQFRHEHGIPEGSAPTVVEKQDGLIKASGYTVYRWTWTVICIGEASIKLEEDFIAEFTKKQEDTNA